MILDFVKFVLNLPAESRLWAAKLCRNPPRPVGTDSRPETPWLACSRTCSCWGRRLDWGRRESGWNVSHVTKMNENTGPPPWYAFRPWNELRHREENSFLTTHFLFLLQEWNLGSTFLSIDLILTFLGLDQYETLGSRTSAPKSALKRKLISFISMYISKSWYECNKFTTLVTTAERVGDSSNWSA